MKLSERLEALLALVEKATPGMWAQSHRKTRRGGYSTEVYDERGEAIATLAWHAVRLNDTTTTTDRQDNAESIVAAINFLRGHGPALAELARRVEDGPVVAIDSAAEHVRLFAEGGPLDRMATSARVLAMDGQRVRLVPEQGEG